MTKSLHKSMFIVARLHPDETGQVMTFEKQIYTDEIEHDAGDAQRDHYNCEILPKVGAGYPDTRDKL